MGKAPAFQFYAADFKMDTDAMSAEAVGAYVRLLCSAWVRGSIPTDPGKLAAVAGVSRRRFARLWDDDLAVHWQTDGNGGLVNRRQEKERKRQEEWRRKSAKGGRATAQARGDQ